MKYLTSLIILFFGFNLSLNSQTITTIDKSIDFNSEVFLEIDTSFDRNPTKRLPDSLHRRNSDLLSIKLISQTNNELDEGYSNYLSFSSNTEKLFYLKTFKSTTVDNNDGSKTVSYKPIKEFDDFAIILDNSEILTLKNELSNFYSDRNKKNFSYENYFYNSENQDIEGRILFKNGELEIDLKNIIAGLSPYINKELWGPNRHKTFMNFKLNNDQFKQLYKLLKKF